MKMTTRSSYGVRALISLAMRHGEKDPVSLKAISEQEGISLVFLEQIFNALKKEGIVRSVRGPKGGYVLAKKPSEITVFDAVNILEGDIRAAKCVGTGCGAGKCGRGNQCATKEVWDELTRQIERTLEGFSLEYLAEKAKRKEARSA